MSVKRLAALVVAMLLVGALIPAGALAKPGGGGGNSPTPVKTCPSTLDGFLAADNVDAYSTGTGTVTYFFSSLEDENSVNGVPGLVGYCVYTDGELTAATATLDTWKASFNAGNVSFVRGGGNKTNIPLDGTSGIQIGTATFSANPSAQTILLHIADSAMCQALYGGDATTCYVLPKAGPVCDAASADTTGVAYSDIPRDAVNCGPPSHAFQATQTKEFGDEVVLGAGGTLKSLTVLFNSYACEDSPQWNNQYCLTTVPGDTFTHPITANLYAVGANHTVGALLDTVTVTQTIPFRPSADTTLCTGASLGGWFNTISGNCEFSAKVLLTFDFTGGVTLTSGENVIWTVAFATSTNGLTPTDSSQCTVNAGCPYDSLNVGTKTFVHAPYVGSFSTGDFGTGYAAFIDSTWNGIYCDDGVGGTGFLRESTITTALPVCTNTEATNNYSPTAWLDYQPLGQINLQ